MRVLSASEIAHVSGGNNGEYLSEDIVVNASRSFGLGWSLGPLFIIVGANQYEWYIQVGLGVGGSGPQIDLDGESEDIQGSKVEFDLKAVSVTGTISGPDAIDFFMRNMSYILWNIEQGRSWTGDSKYPIEHGKYSKMRRLFLLGALLTASCAAQQPAQDVFVANEELHLQGRIDEISLRLVLDSSPTDYKRFVISSQGGKIDSALDMVQYLNSIGKPVVVRKVCLSACASIVLALSQRRYVAEGAVIAFHGTQSSLLLMHDLAVRNGTPPTLDAYSYEIGRREVESYQLRGVDRRLLFLPAVVRGSTCFIMHSYKDGSVKFATIPTISRFSLSRETLAEYGITYEIVEESRTPEGKVRPAVSLSFNENASVAKEDAVGWGPAYLDQRLPNVSVKGCGRLAKGFDVRDR